jgi:hypothetical protein
MITRITDVYVAGTELIAAVEGPGVRRVNGRGDAVLSVVPPAALEWPPDAMRSAFRLTDDRQRVEWPEDNRSLAVADLLDDRYARFYFVQWDAAAARPALREDELVGGWQDAAGYRLFQPGGLARIVRVGKGYASDAPGTLRWKWNGPEEFEAWAEADPGKPTIPSPMAAPQRFIVVAFDGRTLIATVVTTLKVRDKSIVTQASAVWQRAELPDPDQTSGQ